MASSLHVLLEKIIKTGDLTVNRPGGSRTFGNGSTFGIAVFLATRPLWARIQRYLMGTVLAALAVKMALESRR